MSFDAIMNEIKAGLTGDSNADIDYLQEQVDKYKDHEDAKKIIMECGKLIYELLPEDQKRALTRQTDTELLGIQKTLEKVRKCMAKHDYNTALKSMEALIKKVENGNVFQNDDEIEYRLFHEAFEELLYRFLYEPTRQLVRCPVPFPHIYLQHGALLLDMQRFDEARETLKKAREWNPVNPLIAFEYAETYKRQNDLETFKDLTLKIFEIAYTPEDVAHCYRNLGYYFLKNNLDFEATACYQLSLQYDRKSKNAVSRLNALKDKNGGALEEVHPEDIVAIFNGYEIPLGPDEDLIGLAYTYGKQMLQQGEPDIARYFLTVSYNLNPNTMVKELLDNLPKPVES